MQRLQNTDQLLTISTTNGVATTVGPFGLGGLEGLAFDDATSTLYGTNTGSVGGTGELVTIDTTTGAATVVGATGYWLFGLAGPAY